MFFLPRAVLALSIIYQNINCVGCSCKSVLRLFVGTYFDSSGGVCGGGGGCRDTWRWHRPRDYCVLSEGVGDGCYSDI